jgi:hypothetical protein
MNQIIALREFINTLFPAEISSTNNLGSASNDIMLKIQKIKVPKEYTIFDHLILN